MAKGLFITQHAVGVVLVGRVVIIMIALIHTRAELQKLAVRNVRPQLERPSV